MSYEFNDFAQQGWQCPICKRVFSPLTPMCYYCGQKDEEVTTTSTARWLIHHRCKKCGEDYWSESARDICPLCGMDQD